MVDRKMVFTGQLPQDTDVLTPQRNTMIGLGALAQAVIGPEDANPQFAVDGFVCAATTPSPSLVLNISPGSVYAQGVIDQSAFGSLPAELTKTTILQGISLSTTALTFVPPATAGFAVNYLIQVGLSTQDTTPIVLPYFNAANPTIPWLGPNNSGVAQNTVRQCVAVVQAKAGVASSAGTQNTPAPDPGFFGLYSVTVANGASALTSSNFSVVGTAPFIPTTLMGVPQNVQSGKWTFAIDTGTANAIVANLSPVPLSLTPGLEFTILKMNANNSAAVTLNLNGTGPIAVVSSGGAALVGGELRANGMIQLSYDGTKYQVVSSSASQAGGPLFDGDATGTNTYTVTNLSPIASGLTHRMLAKISFATANNAASTLNVGFGPNGIVLPNQGILSGGEITGQHLLSFDLPTTTWQLLTPSVQDSLVHFGIDTGTANAKTATVTPAIQSYRTGSVYWIQVQNSNTGATLINLNGLGNRTVVLNRGGAPLTGSELRSGMWHELVFDGTNLRLINSAATTAIPNILSFTSNGTYTPSTGIRAIRGRVWAAGAGGTTVGFQNGVNSGSGGGAGEYREGVFLITAGGGISVVIGIGGVAGADGSDSILGTLITSHGGHVSAALATGGIGGSLGTGGFSFPGGNGNGGLIIPSSGVSLPGYGGAAFGGSQSLGGGSFPGGGGGGGNGGATAPAGQNVGSTGGNGLIIIEELP